MKNSFYKWWLLGLMMVSTFMAVLDTTIVNVGLPSMMRYFNDPLIDVEWVVTGYLLSMCVMLPSAGWMAQKWGYRRLFYVGMVIFTLGSLFCALSETLPQLVAARIFEGFGSGIIQPLAMAVVVREFEPRERGLALGMWAVAAAASVSMGPYLGGVLVSEYAWNSLFVVNIPIGIVTIIATFFIMKESKGEGVGRFDILGFLLIGLALPLLVVALTLGSDHGWGSLTVVTLIASSFAMLYLFVRRSLRVKSPLLDLRIFRFKTFSISIIAISFFGIGLYSGNYLLPLYLEHSMSYTAMAAGAVFLPVGIIQGVLAPFSGILSRFTGTKTLVVAGMLVFVSYFMVSAFFDMSTPHWLIMLSLYLRGVGIGLAFTPLNTLSVSELSREEMASASGMSNTVKQVSGSIGIALFTALLSSRVAHHALWVSASEAYVKAISESFMMAGLLSVLGLVAVLFLKQKK